MINKQNIEAFDLNIGQNYLSDWEVLFALREIIANALDAKSDKHIEMENTKDGAFMIRDFGEGLKPENFVFQESDKRKSKGKIGKFGMGLKDAIGVLWSREIKVKIRTKDYKISFGMRKKTRELKTLHALFEKIENDDFIGTEFKIFNCLENDISDAISQFIKFQNPKILSSTSYGQIIDKDINKTASIYINGMKVAEDDKLRFSYNITSPSSNLEKGINRDRKNVSRSVYQSDLVKMIAKVDDNSVLDILQEQFERTYGDNSLSEVTWTEVVIKVCNYIIRKEDGKVVFITNDDIDNNYDEYNNLIQSRKVKVFKVSSKIKSILEKKMERLESTKIFLDAYIVDIFETVDYETLSEGEKEVLDKVIKLLKSINVLRGEGYLLDSVRISKENCSYSNHNGDVVIIPRTCLRSVESCASSLINALSSIRIGSQQFKDLIIGQLCSEFLEAARENSI